MDYEWYMGHLFKRTTVVPNISHFSSGKQLVTLPYKIGVIAGLAGGLLSIPLVCHKGSAVWFNDNFVHCPEPDDGLDSLENAWCAPQ